MKALVITLAAIGVISWVLILKFGTKEFCGAYFLGALLGTLNGLVGFYVIEKFIDKSNIVFLKGVSLGMGGRLLLLLGVFIILMDCFKIPIIPLVTGLLIFYFTMTVFEVIFLNKRIALKGTDKGTAR